MVYLGGKNVWENIPYSVGVHYKIENSDPEHTLEFSYGASRPRPSAAGGKTLRNKVEENTEKASGELKYSEQESETEKSLEQTNASIYLPVAEGIGSLESDKAVQTETGKAIRTETEQSTAEDEVEIMETARQAQSSSPGKIEKLQAEHAAQITMAATAEETGASAEALAGIELLECHLRGAKERETLLVQEHEELRKTLSRTEQQAAIREDTLQREIEDLHQHYQASIIQCQGQLVQIPQLMSPLFRQIEAQQAAMESMREELVEMREQCERLRGEAAAQEELISDALELIAELDFKIQMMNSSADIA